MVPLESESSKFDYNCHHSAVFNFYFFTCHWAQFVTKNKIPLLGGVCSLVNDTPVKLRVQNKTKLQFLLLCVIFLSKIKLYRFYLSQNQNQKNPKMKISRFRVDYVRKTTRHTYLSSIIWLYFHQVSFSEGKYCHS